MQKTEGKKTVIVIDEQGNNYESTYPKRAKGLVKTGRARYVDENTICLTCPPKEYILEENNMNNENKLINDNNERKIDELYVLEKIDQLMKMNSDFINNPSLKDMATVPGSKNPVQSICETNNLMIGFLKEIYFSIKPKQQQIDTNSIIIQELVKCLNKAIEDGADEDVIRQITSTIATMKIN